MSRNIIFIKIKNERIFTAIMESYVLRKTTFQKQ